MDFTIIKYTIKTGESYSSIAKKIVSLNEKFNDHIDCDFFIQSVKKGLKILLKNKQLIANEQIKLVKEIEYYLNVVPVGTKGMINVGSSSPTEIVINQLGITNDDLCFIISEYIDYKSYAWIEFKYDGERKYGEIGTGEVIRGDKLKAKQVTNGFIYVFDDHDVLKHTFVIENSMYQEVVLTRSNFKYSNKKGGVKKFALIPDYYSGQETIDLKLYRFVFSNATLSKKRLFGSEGNSSMPEFNVPAFYRSIPEFTYDLRDLKEKRTGQQILAAYRRREPILLNYYWVLNKSFGNNGNGINIFYPDPLKELNRRAIVYQERLKAKDVWLNDEFRSQQKFLHSLVNQMIKKDSSLTGYASLPRMNEWERVYRQEIMLLNHKIHYAAKDLCAWLESNVLHQCLFNHITSDRKEDVLVVIDAYQNALTGLDQTWQGENFYKRQLNDPKSFIGIVLGINEKDDPRHDVLKKIILLNPQYFNQDKNAGMVAFGRKLEQASFGLVKKSAPAILKLFGNKTLISIVRRIVRYSSGVGSLKLKKISPLNNVSQTFMGMDVKYLRNKFKSIGKGNKLKGVIGLIEAANVYFAVKLLIEDPEHRNRNIAAVLGASLDFATENSWLFKMAAQSTSSKAFASISAPKLVPGLQFISGVIDAFIGVDSAVSAHQNGEFGLRNGYAIFAVGGAISAVGAGMIYSGGVTATASVGTLSIPAGALVIIGSIVEGVGLAVAYYWDNRAVKDWISTSIFGDEPEVPKALYNLGLNEFWVQFPKKVDVSTTHSQIARINEILCDFKVEASFRDVEMRFDNTTYVTIVIQPGLISETATIKFTNMRALAESRWGELFQSEQHHVVGMAGSENPTIKLADIINDPSKVVKDAKGIIKEIKVEFDYPMDIDIVKGNIAILFSSGSFQGLSKDFIVEA